MNITHWGGEHQGSDPWPAEGPLGTSVYKALAKNTETNQKKPWKSDEIWWNLGVFLILQDLQCQRITKIHPIHKK